MTLFIVRCLGLIFSAAALYPNYQLLLFMRKKSKLVKGNKMSSVDYLLKANFRFLALFSLVSFASNVLILFTPIYLQRLNAFINMTYTFLTMALSFGFYKLTRNISETDS